MLEHARAAVRIAMNDYQTHGGTLAALALSDAVDHLVDVELRLEAAGSSQTAEAA